jgi:hypothetical protein
MKRFIGLVSVLVLILTTLVEVRAEPVLGYFYIGEQEESEKWTFYTFAYSDIPVTFDLHVDYFNKEGKLINQEDIKVINGESEYVDIVFSGDTDWLDMGEYYTFSLSVNGSEVVSKARMGAAIYQEYEFNIEPGAALGIAAEPAPEPATEPVTEQTPEPEPTQEPAQEPVIETEPAQEPETIPEPVIEVTPEFEPAPEPTSNPTAEGSLEVYNPNTNTIPPSDLADAGDYPVFFVPLVAGLAMTILLLLVFRKKKK